MPFPHLRPLAPVLALLAGVLSAQKGSWGVRAEVAATLSSVTSWSEVARSRDELVHLGTAVLPELFGCLAAGEVEVREATALPLDEPRRATLIAAIGSFSRADVVACLGQLARADSPERLREEGLRLLGGLGTKNDFRLALQLGAPSDSDGPVGPDLQLAFERALSGIASRDPGALQVLAGFFPRAHPALQGSIAHALAGEKAGLALGRLVSALGTASPDADALLLLEIGELERRFVGTPDISDPEPDISDLEKVRGYLGHPDPGLAALACVAIQKLGDEDAVPDLITLLDHGQPNVRCEARRALARLTGLQSGADSARWLLWLDMELAWWDERAETCGAALSSGSTEDAAAALQELGHRRLFPARVTGLVALALQRKEADLVRLGCRMLESLHSRSAIPALLAALEAPDPEVVASAHRALKKITGLSLPPIEGAWRARLGLEE